MEISLMNQSLIKYVGCCVRRLRNDRGISQEDLAEKADLDRTYISGVERSVRNISLNSLESIIGALEMSIPEFILELQKEYDRE